MVSFEITHLYRKIGASINSAYIILVNSWGKVNQRIPQKLSHHKL